MDGVYHEYKEGEVKGEEFLVVGSDGIWDNLKDHMIYQIVEKKGESLVKKAGTLTTAANHYGSMRNYESPFYTKAK